MVKNRNSKRWLAPAAIFFSAFVIWGLVRFLAEPDHRYIVRGIDVSAHTGEINWQIVKGQRVSFVFVKASEGATLSDKNYRKNFYGAKSVGIPVSAYHFFNFNRDGERQAYNYLCVVSLADMDLPPVVDVEEWGNRVRRSRREIISDLKEFIAIVERNAGKKLIIYTNEDTYRIYIKDNFPQNDIWICSFNHKPDIDGQWTFWQYSHTGHLKGVDGKVDFNVFGGTSLEWKNYLGR
ncbi:MAG: glycoside hydrolase family 25 protein [Bacteroidales bacterium]